MIWLTLRQFRTQAMTVFGGLAVLGAVLAVTGPGLSDDYGKGLASCADRNACAAFADGFFDEHRAYFGALAIVVMVLPAVIGVFWGAPLITRELESGTHRLAWSQSITRTRWLAVKLGLLGLAAMVAAGLAVLAAEWWSDPLDEAAGERLPRVAPLLFDARGVVPVGHAAFAFALGVALGVVVRRTLPAMAITLAVFVAVQIAMPLLVRPYLIPPESETVTISAENQQGLMLDDGTVAVQTKAERGAWKISNHTVDSSGREVESIPRARLAQACDPRAPNPGAEPPPGPPPDCFERIARLGYRQKIVYQPAGRFWPLQWAETGLFAVLALGLTGVCFHWTRRRVS